LLFFYLKLKRELKIKSRSRAIINKFLSETKIGVIFQLALIPKEIPDEPLSVLLNDLYVSDL